MAQIFLMHVSTRCKDNAYSHRVAVYQHRKSGTHPFGPYHLGVSLCMLSFKGIPLYVGYIRFIVCLATRKPSVRLP